MLQYQSVSASTRICVYGTGVNIDDIDISEKYPEFVVEENSRYIISPRYTLG